MDAAYLSSHGLVAFEWETGNVASCHRSINKICLGFHIGAIAGGILALSSNSLYPYLTDRVGTSARSSATFRYGAQPLVTKECWRSLWSSTTRRPRMRR
jgi:hypothetical protein